MKNFKKSLLMLTNGLKSSIEKKKILALTYKKSLLKNRLCNEFDFFLENKEYRPFDGYKIEI